MRVNPRTWKRRTLVALLGIPIAVGIFAGAVAVTQGGAQGGDNRVVLVNT